MTRSKHRSYDDYKSMGYQKLHKHLISVLNQAHRISRAKSDLTSVLSFVVLSYILDAVTPS
jgi:hypothetical protein